MEALQSSSEYPWMKVRDGQLTEEKSHRWKSHTAGYKTLAMGYKCQGQAGVQGAAVDTEDSESFLRLSRIGERKTVRPKNTIDVIPDTAADSSRL